tara:strand:- start:497 stop:1249 length:753 start_codon:yes stop_codon:yes gene_type:complete
MKKIYVDDVGKGFPLILIHGYLGSSEMWCNQKDYFSKFSRVITPALPGFGESSSVKSLASIEAMALKMIETIDGLKIEKFNLMGHSMGGMIVQEMTKICRNRINKLICFATSSLGEIPGRFETMNQTRQKLKDDGLAETLSRVPKKWFVKGDRDKNYYLCQNAVKNVSFESADNALIAMENWSGINELKNIKNETLIVWGDKDSSYNFEQVNTLKKNIKNSRLEIFENCSHNVHLEKPKEFNLLIESFIN